MTDFLHYIFPGAPVSKEKQIADDIIAALKGGEGSGNFGHAGRPGEVGGSSRSGNLVIRGYLENRLFRNERNLTQDELEKINNRWNDNPKEIKKLITGKDPVYISVEDGRAETSYNRIRLSEQYLGTEISDHELLHAAVNTNNRLRYTIVDNYKPPFMYRHTERYENDFESALGEQFVMVMTAYNPDESKWIDNVSYIEKSLHPRARIESQRQVEAARDYLRSIKIW